MGYYLGVNKGVLISASYDFYCLRIVKEWFLCNNNLWFVRIGATLIIWKGTNKWIIVKCRMQIGCLLGRETIFFGFVLLW